MSSPLSFDATLNFRNKLLNRNLEPYSVTGAFSPTGRPGSVELVQTDLSVIDSLSVEQIGDQQEDLLVVLNKYGPEGVAGFGDIIDINVNKGTQPNQGNYDYFTSEPPKTTQQSVIDAFVKNEYGPQAGWDGPISIQTIQNIITNRQEYYTFIASSYSPFQLLISNNPQGDNGRLSEDSDLAKIAAQALKDDFIERAAQELRQQTIGRLNINTNDPTRQDPFRILGIATGRIPIIERDYKISVPDSIIGKSLDFVSRIGGVTSPFSFIPGDYFATVENKVGKEQTRPLLSRLFERNNLIGSAVKWLSNKPETDAESSSQIFLNNSGGGQVSALFNNLQFNSFRPNYEIGFIERLTIPSSPGNYYVGSVGTKAKNITFPLDALPRNQFGESVEAPVYGYDALATDYETGDSGSVNTFQFALGSTALNESSGYYPERVAKPSGGITGGFVWTDTNDGGLGKRPGPTNDDPQQEIDSSWISTKSSYETKRSSNFTFKGGSILDDTQKLVDASKDLPGDKKLKHAGNAINQVSKIFSDGYNIMTKGSRVIRYTDVDGYESGYEYCRIFTKDTPFYENSDLQKTDGNIRQSTYSILDNTYNLNIAPYRGDDSTNLTGNDFDSEGVKKYMFSLENLAWRTSNREGITYNDLANCEKGPNGGRIMWFPPYDIRVDESVATRWTSNEFLGRPEPIYTYNNTTRTGNLSWKIVVDHPSIMNLIIDKELKGQNGTKLNAIVDSFIAGCLKYDIYDLVGKYPQFRPEDIYKIVENIKTQQDYEELVNNLTFEREEPIDPGPDTFGKDEIFVVYFENDRPDKNTRKTTSTVDYQSTFNLYRPLLEGTPSKYELQAFETGKTGVRSFSKTIIESYDKTVSFLNTIGEKLDEGKKVTLDLLGSASADMPNDYNINLSKRRIDSVLKWIRTFKTPNNKSFASLIDGKKLIINTGAQGEDVFDDVLRITDINNNTINCTQIQAGPPNLRQQQWEANGKKGPVPGPDDIEVTLADGTKRVGDSPLPADIIAQQYSQSAMACRRVRIDIAGIEESTEDPPEQLFRTVTGVTTVIDPRTSVIEESTRESQLRTDIAKRVLRRTLTECDYFQVMKEDTPVAYDSIKEKFKYFQPAFHSMTPEGLNTRLTFLQQCMRPGDTIPTIQKDSDGRVTRVYNDAFNTAFGAPPICILRFGDFYHSKIVINSLSIRYDPLVYDLNPEGIGVQPMIADISMSFNFIGGEGLKEPVAKLQNALSFNYYANTEMYDDRADMTEDFQSRFDAQILEDIKKNIDVDKPIDSRPLSKDGGVTIGFVERKVSVIETGTVTGITSYQQITKDLVSDAKNVVETTTTSLEKINNDFSYGTLKLFVYNKNYTDGVMNTNATVLFGKPYDTQKLVDSLFTKVIGEIDDGTSPLVFNVILKGKYEETIIKSFKQSLKKVIKTEEDRFLSELPEVIQTMSNEQIKLVKTIDRLNFVLTESNGTSTGSDGYITKPGNTIIYSITGTTEVDSASTGTPSDTLQELQNDYQIIADDLDEFNDKMIQYGLVTFQGNEYNLDYTYSCVPPAEKYQKLDFQNQPVVIPDEPLAFVPTFTALGRYIMDRPDEFANQVVLGMVFQDKSLAPRFESDFTKQIQFFSGIFKRVQSASEDSFTDFRNQYFNSTFDVWNPYGNLDKTRKFTFSKITDQQLSTELLNIYSNINSGDNSTYNGKNTFK